MNSSDVIRRLRDHESELHAAGIRHISIFGSVARNQAVSGSDIDLMIELDNSRPQTLITIGRLQSDLSELLGGQVDLTFRGAMRPPVSQRVFNEAILAF